MKSINVSYVIYFNRKYQRCGHLFQDRFKSELVGTNEYLMVVSRYIHLNPVRAGIVSSDKLYEYRWSSCRHYILAEAGGQLPIDTAFILGLLADSPELGRTRYREYVMQGEAMDGDNGTVALAGLFGTALQQTADDTEDREQIPALEAEELLRPIATTYGEGSEDNRKKRSRQVGNRNQAIREMRKRTQMTLKEIGSLFGGLSESMISKILKTD